MSIRISVYLSVNSERPAMERLIDWNDSLAFPFESVFKSNKALFGKDCITKIELI